MNTRSSPFIAIAVILLLAAAAVLWAAGAASASTGHSWYTCVPQATLHKGIYQYDNDLFAGRTGRSCITVTGNAMTIDRNYIAQPGGVVAYPAIRIGTYAYNRDPGSGLPAPVSDVKLNLRIRDTGSNSGYWIDDLDVWFARPDTPTQHIRELIVVTRWSGYAGYCDPYGAKIARRHWHAGMCETSSGGRHWPLIRFIARRQTRRLTVTLAAFIKVARRHHWISAGMVVASVSAGTECWRGCAGLTDSMRASP